MFTFSVCTFIDGYLFYLQRMIKYWSSSPRPGAGDLESYSLGFTSNSVNPLNRNGRNQGRMVVPSWFE